MSDNSLPPEWDGDEPPESLAELLEPCREVIEERAKEDDQYGEYLRRIAEGCWGDE